MIAPHRLIASALSPRPWEGMEQRREALFAAVEELEQVEGAER